MTTRLPGLWQNSAESVTQYSYKCGYCGAQVGPSKRYTCISGKSTAPIREGSIYICPNCNKPTFINIKGKEQVPGPIVGENIEFLPEDVEQLYDEARKCISVNAYTASVLACRKILMNVAVSKGAEPGKSFASYVTFLEDNHFIPPNSRDWVDHIRKKGNEATHEIPNISKEDAIELLEFVEMLLRFVYEMPGKMSKYRS
jgi:Domain of unknown function (DUF4145)